MIKKKKSQARLEKKKLVVNYTSYHRRVLHEKSAKPSITKSKVNHIKCLITWSNNYFFSGFNEILRLNHSTAHYLVTLKMDSYL